MNEEKKLSIMQTAIKAEKSMDTIRRWIREKKLPAKRNNFGHWEILETDLEEYLKSLEDK